jgi:hypothetical protein
MSPLYSITALRRETHAELLKSDNPVITLALHQQLKSLTNTDTRHRVAVSLSREVKPAPIRSAKITSQTLPDKSTHWSWDDKNASAAKRVEKLRAAYVLFFNEQPEASTFTKLSTFKTWKAALTALNLTYFLELTPEAITEDKDFFLATFTKKLNAYNPPSV